MAEEDIKDRDMQIIVGHVAQLMEHFDSVQIFCTRHDPVELDGTINIAWGGGNWFARYGQIKRFIIKEEANIDD